MGILYSRRHWYQPTYFGFACKFATKQVHRRKNSDSFNVHCCHTRSRSTGLVRSTSHFHHCWGRSPPQFHASRLQFCFTAKPLLFTAKCWETCWAIYINFMVLNMFRLLCLYQLLVISRCQILHCLNALRHGFNTLCKTSFSSSISMVWTYFL